MNSSVRSRKERAKYRGTSPHRAECAEAHFYNHADGGGNGYPFVLWTRRSLLPLGQKERRANKYAPGDQAARRLGGVAHQIRLRFDGRCNEVLKLAVVLVTNDQAAPNRNRPPRMKCPNPVLASSHQEKPTPHAPARKTHKPRPSRSRPVRSFAPSIARTP